MVDRKRLGEIIADPNASAVDRFEASSRVVVDMVGGLDFTNTKTNLTDADLQEVGRRLLKDGIAVQVSGSRIRIGSMA